MSNDKRKRAPKRPLVLPEPIPDSVENVIGALVGTPPKRRKDWRYLKRENG